MKQLNCILLIDDNVDDNYFHSRVIRNANAAQHIKTTETGEEALEYFELGKRAPGQYPLPDLIFLDINMPGMNGFDLLEKIKEEKIITEDRPVIIVMLTSSLNPGDEKMATEKYSNEIKAFQNKPLTQEVLNELIEKFF
ncbi:response regulator [Terrimonas pollutisoli]|uniref:response regulator n=1 Tax=Terrimonas pollutisoli TaxID=3034147 RepID=UPI0023EAEEDD|nr:response regulator [Terrimonas sp. H1YJ31]